MNLQEVFKKIEMAFTPEVEETQEEVKVEMANMKLADGTMLEAEAFEAGQNVFLVDEEGNKVAAPVGEHNLEDGRVLVIVEEGVIAEIKEMPVAEEEAPEVEIEIEQAAEPEYVTKEEFTAAVNELKDMMAAMMPKEEEMSAEVETAVEAEVEMSADEPAAKKVTAAPVEKKPDMVQFSKKAGGNTLSRVFSKLS